MKVFVEEQRFTQWWLYFIIALTIIILLVKEKFSIKDNESVGSLVFSMIILSLILVLFLLLKLTTKIDERGIKYKFEPFHFSSKLIAWNDISKCYVRKYKPIIEYGGWGLKGGTFWNKSKGVAYNVKGNIGLQLVLKNGKKILIGTQQENDLKRVLLTYKYKIIDNEN